eukprot:1035018-Rhodomonas_salina.2
MPKHEASYCPRQNQSLNSTPGTRENSYKSSASAVLRLAMTMCHGRRSLSMRAGVRPASASMRAFSSGVTYSTPFAPHITSCDA